MEHSETSKWHLFFTRIKESRINHFVIISIISFLGALVQISSINPLVLPIIAFTYLIGVPELIVALSATLISSLIFGIPYFLATLIATSILLVLILASSFFKKIKLPTRLLIAVPLATILGGINPDIGSEYLLVVVNAVVSVWVTYFLLQQVASFQIKGKKLSVSGLITFLLLIQVVSSALPTTEAIQPAFIIASVFSLIFIKTTTPSTAFLFILLSHTINLFIVNLSPEIFTISLIPFLFIALVKDFPKITLSFFYLALFYLTSQYFDYPIIDNFLFFNPLIAVSLFLITDNRALKKMEVSLKTTLSEKYATFGHAKGRVMKKIASLGNLIEELGKELVRKDDSVLMRQAIEEIYLSLCASCPKAQICFQSENERIVSLMPKGIIKGLKREELHFIEINCLKPAKLLGKLEDKKRSYAVEYRAHQEGNQLKELIGSQLKGISRFLYTCSTEIESESETPLNLSSAKIKKEIEEQGLEVIYFFLSDNLQKTQVQGAIARAEEKDIKDIIIPIIKRELMMEISITKLQKMGLESWRFELESIHSYQLSYGVSQVGKDFLHCGDTYRFFRGNQETVLAISDGMGSGQVAATESQLTVSLLEKMLQSGISAVEAIENLNTLLKIKNQQDMYATLDIMSFNNRNGRAQFTKSGAYPSYLIRNKKLIKIENHAAPVGIVDSLDIKSTTCSLENNDLIVMMSDGIETQLGNILEQELISINDDDPQKYTSTLLSKCQLEQGVNDDITIIAAKVKVV